MKREIVFEEDEKENLKKKGIVIAITIVLISIILIAIVIVRSQTEKENINDEVEQELLNESEEPNHVDENLSSNEEQKIVEDDGEYTSETAVVQVPVNENEIEGVAYGIDVSMYQGIVDWEKVAASGVEFAMIRVGYRNNEGEIILDETAKYNMQEAAKNGIPIGVYFFSRAISVEEASKEATFVLEIIEDYPITYPVVYNCEGYNETSSRQYGLSVSERTSFAIQFLDEIYAGGYYPMFYAAANHMLLEQWDQSELEQRYKIWIAKYSSTDSANPDYIGEYAMWQYSEQGTVPGINYDVDLDTAYFKYQKIATAQNENAVYDEVANVEVLMNFVEVDETVTAKDVTNLRDRPSQGEDSTVLEKLYNGDIARRTAVSDNGWSRVEFKGTIYYAVSNYLTTDLLTSSPVEEEVDSAFTTGFEEVNEQVTAKISTNLRNMPSVTNDDSVVVATIVNGDIVTRTGVNEEYGWSRIEYNGQVLYCVSSYLYVMP